MELFKSMQKIKLVSVSLSALIFFNFSLLLSSCSTHNAVTDLCSPVGINKVSPRPSNTKIETDKGNSSSATLKPAVPLTEINVSKLKLRSPHTITVGTMADAPPNACANSQGNFTGFDNELIKAAATKLGLKTNFIANDFSALLDNTARGNFDVAAASINTTDERKKIVDFSNPYDFGYSALITFKNNPVTNFDSLTTQAKNIGVILGTIEDNYANKHHINAAKYPDYVTIVNKLKSGQLDAWIAPATQAVMEVEKDSNLTIKQYLFSTNSNVSWAISKNNPYLTVALNSALDALIADGTWMKLFSEWVPRQLPIGWKPGSTTAKVPDTSALNKALQNKKATPEPGKSTTEAPNIWQQLHSSFFDWNIIKSTLHTLLKTGLKNTIIVTFFATIIALVLGSILAVASISKHRIIRWPARIYIDVLRGLPELLVVMLIGIGLQPLFKNITGNNPQPLGIIGLGCLAASYTAEVLRSGMNSVDKGQIEAASALGLTRGQTIINVLIPQGYRKVLPAIMNQFISILKASSLLFIIGLTYSKSDIFTLAKISNGYTGNLSPLVAAGICYLIITIPLTYLVDLLDKHLNLERN